MLAPAATHLRVTAENVVVGGVVFFVVFATVDRGTLLILIFATVLASDIATVGIKDGWSAGCLLADVPVFAPLLYISV